MQNQAAMLKVMSDLPSWLERMERDKESDNDKHDSLKRRVVGGIPTVFAAGGKYV